MQSVKFELVLNLKTAKTGRSSAIRQKRAASSRARTPLRLVATLGRLRLDELDDGENGDVLNQAEYHRAAVWRRVPRNFLLSQYPPPTSAGSPAPTTGPGTANCAS
jgi:hypothetical protein